MPPPKPPTEDESCSFIFPDGDARAGTKCTAWRRTNSTFCYFHDGGAKELATLRQRQAERLKQLEEELTFGFHNLRTLDDLNSFLEKTVNGVMTGLVKRDKAGMLAMFIPQLYKVIKDLNGGTSAGARGNNIQINIGNIEHNKLTASLTPDNIDQFLLSDQAVSVKMIQDLQKDGNLKVEKRKDKPEVIEVTATEVPKPEELKIPKKELAQLTKKTDVPLTAKEVEDLFGDTFGDTEDAGRLPLAPDATGFGELFEKGAEPIELKEKPHKWKIPGTPKPNKPGSMVAVMWYTCLKCGMETDNQRQAGMCPKPDYSADYEAIGYEPVNDETMERTEEENLFD